MKDVVLHYLPKFVLFQKRLLKQDGCVQVRVRVVPQEAERCHEVSAQNQVLAISPTYQGKLFDYYINFAKIGEYSCSYGKDIFSFWRKLYPECSTCICFPILFAV